MVNVKELINNDKFIGVLEAFTDDVFTKKVVRSPELKNESEKPFYMNLTVNTIPLVSYIGGECDITGCVNPEDKLHEGNFGVCRQVDKLRSNENYDRLLNMIFGTFGRSVSDMFCKFSYVYSKDEGISDLCVSTKYES